MQYMFLSSADVSASDYQDDDDYRGGCALVLFYQARRIANDAYPWMGLARQALFILPRQHIGELAECPPAYYKVVAHFKRFFTQQLPDSGTLATSVYSH